MEAEIRSVYEIFTGFLNDALGALPDFLMAATVLILFIVAGKTSKSWARRLAEKIWDDPSLQSLAATITSTIFIVLGFFVAAAVLFPGLEAGDLVGVLGLSGVAIGFAFKDIFQNFMAGVLILSRRPFRIGDQITTNEFDGTVHEITFRSTQLETYDGELVIIPNAAIFTNPVQVHTAKPQRRSHFGAGIGYDEDIDTAKRVILDAIVKCDLVADEPAAKVWTIEHGASSINFDVLFWTDSDRASVMDARDQVATAVKYALDEAEIEIPFPQRTLHFSPATLDPEGHLALSVHEQSETNSGVSTGEPGGENR